MKRSVLLIFFLFFLCQTQDISAEDEFIFILPSKANLYWRLMSDGIEQTAKAHKQKVTVFLIEEERASEVQLNTCDAAIERKPRFIGMAAVNLAVGIQCLKRAQEKGISVAELDSTIPLDKAKEAGLHLAFSIGSDNYQIGKKAAQHASFLLQGKDSSVVIIEGPPGNAPGKARVDGFRDELSKTAPKAKIISSMTAEWDRMKAMNMMSETLLRSPQVNLVYAANDQMALGAIEGLRIAGRLGSVFVIGVDGIEDARHSVKKGEMSATVAQLPYFVGKRAMERAIEVIAGKTVPLREQTETPVLTKEVLEKGDAPYLQYVH
jgi:ribose transport system substrate-binding protein/D-allose transport system substrate-binding protein